MVTLLAYFTHPFIIDKIVHFPYNFNIIVYNRV